MFSTDFIFRKLENLMLTTRNVRLDSGHYATKYYFQPKTNKFCPQWSQFWVLDMSKIDFAMLFHIDICKKSISFTTPRSLFFINFALNANTAKFMLILPPHDPDLENVCYLLIFFENESRMNFYITFSILYKTKLKLQKLVKIKTLWRGEKNGTPYPLVLTFTYLLQFLWPSQKTFTFVLENIFSIVQELQFQNPFQTSFFLTF